MIFQIVICIVFGFSLFNAIKDQGGHIFLSGVSWDGQEGLKDAEGRISSLQLKDVDIVSWWAGDNNDQWSGEANGIGNVCEPDACFILEYSPFKMRAGHVRLIQKNNGKYVYKCFYLYDIINHMNI